MIPKVGERQTKRKLCDDLQQFGKGFVVSGPPRRAKAMAAYSSHNTGRRRSVKKRGCYSESLALDVFITPLVDIPYNVVKPCLKPLEAAGLGIPVIASRVGSYADDLTHEDTALLVANTTEAWLAALTRVVGDAELRAHLAAQGRAWAATRTINQTCPLWTGLWEAA